MSIGALELAIILAVLAVLVGVTIGFVVLMVYVVRRAGPTAASTDHPD